MTEDERKVAEAFAKCADARLPDDFAERLVERIRENDAKKGGTVKGVLVRLALVAASLTLLLGFVPNVLDSSSEKNPGIVAHCDDIRPYNPAMPQGDRLNALAMLGFCREIIRRRVWTLVMRCRRREDEE